MSSPSTRLSSAGTRPGGRLQRAVRRGAEGSGAGSESTGLPATGARQPARRETGAERTGNLPHPLSPFVGREQELREVGASLQGARLVTLTGAGGIGKT